jgi:hypothetical protein
MRYEKAKDILPDELLKEIQKYAAGRLLYIPNKEERKNWGEASGCRQKIKKRNCMICNKYANGTTVAALAEEYFLSEESIKKIVYSKHKDKEMEYTPTLYCAKEYSNGGMTEEWLHSYLLFTCKNKHLSQQLLLINRYYIGPVKFPLRLIHEQLEMSSLCLEEIQDITSNQDNLPPLLVHYEQGTFYLDEDIALYRAYKHNNTKSCYVIIWMTESEEYDQFMKQYGRYINYQ